MPELEEKKRDSGIVIRRRENGQDEDEMATGGLAGSLDDFDEVEEDAEKLEVTLSESASDTDAEEEEEEEERPRPSRRAARRPNPSARRARSRSTEVMKEELDDEFLDMLGALEYGAEQHKISVSRLEPQTDPFTGKNIGGHQGSFYRPISADEIQKLYGGGLFKIIVNGPRADTGRGNVMKAAKTVRIAGEPIPLKSPQEEARKRKAEEQQKDDLVKTLLEREDRRAEEAKREAREAQKAQNDLLARLLDKPKEDPQIAMATAMAPMLTMMQENEKRREEQQRADREREDRRREEEREERRRREEQERQRYEADMRRQEQQFALQMEQVKMQQEQMKAQMLAESGNSRQSLELMMGFMQRADADKESRAKEQTQLQVQVMGQMNEMQRSMLEGQLQMMQAQLADAKNKDDFFEYMEKFQTIQALLNPSDDREGWERAVDKVTDVLPNVIPGLAALGSMRGNGGGQPLTQTPAEQRMMPGSTVVVEDVDRVTAQVAGRPVAGVNGPAVVDPNAFQPPQLPAAQEEEAPKEEPAMKTNDLTDFVPYPEDGDNEEVLVQLVKMLDLGLSRGMDVDALYDKCIAPMPVQQRGFLKMLPADVILSFIENNVPEEWPIRSLDGEEKLREIHEKLVASA
jgi:hypothetical protein